MKVRAHLLISGLVQGVNFRWFVKTEARLLGLVGLVRNIEKGQVEIICEGAEDKVQKLISKVKQGMNFSQVHEVKVADEQPRGEYKDFDIVYD